MNGLRDYNTTRNTAGRRRGLTLAEILVAIAIVSILLGILVVSSKAVLRSQDRSDAKQEMMMIAAAIDKYATFWPAWQLTDNSGNLVKIADRGWPDYMPARLFDSSTAQSGFLTDQTGRFNSPSVPGLLYAVDSRGETYVPAESGLVEAPGRPDQVIEGTVLNANICLAYALTSKTGEGPYLVIDDDKAILRDVAENVPTYSPTFPRPRTGAATNLHAASPVGRKLMLVDPWGTPYRYFWVFRCTVTPSGFAPVGDGRINNTGGPNELDVFHRAVGYVLESAGPDRKFGNRWLPSPQQADIDDAADNIIIQRP